MFYAYEARKEYLSQFTIDQDFKIEPRIRTDINFKILAFDDQDTQIKFFIISNDGELLCFLTERNTVYTVSLKYNTSPDGLKSAADSTDDSQSKGSEKIIAFESAIYDKLVFGEDKDSIFISSR